MHMDMQSDDADVLWNVVEANKLETYKPIYKWHNAKVKEMS